MSKTISVKVKTSVLVEALKKALNDRAKRHAENEKLQAEYDKAHAKWKADITKAVLSSIRGGKAKVTEVTPNTWAHRHNRASDKNSIPVTLELEVAKSLITDEPERPNIYNDYEWRADKEALEGAIRVLEMSDQEVVSTSTYHSVVKYL